MLPPVSYENRKLNGRNTMIFNVTSAERCPSHALGLCQLSKKECYAMKAERLYPQSRAFRKRQTEWWDEDGDLLAFLYALKPGIEYFRYSEAGDFRHQVDVDKMTVVCDLLSEARGVKCYGYTKRVDLRLDGLNKASNVILGEHEKEGFSTAKVIPRKANAPEGWHLCPGKNCMVDCAYCATERGGRVALKKR